MFVLLTLLLTTGGAEEVKLESFSPGSPPVDLLVDVEASESSSKHCGNGPSDQEHGRSPEHPNLQLSFDL